MQEILPVLESRADQNKKEIDICDQHLEKILRKVYPVRQAECNISSQHKIDPKIKKAQMTTMGRLNRRLKALPKMTGKQKMKHRNVTLIFMSITGSMRNMNKLRRTLEREKRKLQN